MKLMIPCMLVALLLAKYLLIDMNKPEPSLEYTARTALSRQIDDFHKTGDGSVDLFIAESLPNDDGSTISAVCGRYGDELFTYSDANKELHFRPKHATADEKYSADIHLAFFWQMVCKHGNQAALKKLLDGVNNADKLWLSNMEKVMKGEKEYLPSSLEPSNQ